MHLYKKHSLKRISKVSCLTFFKGDSLIHRSDPRVRILVATLFSLVVALSSRLNVVSTGLGVSIFLILLSRLPFRGVGKRLLHLNVFMFFVGLSLLLTTKGEPLFRVGILTASKQGALSAATIALKANAMVLALTALISTVEITTLGHALSHLRVPDKLIYLFLFTVRYVEVIHTEHERLSRSMKIRCFKPRMSMHTYRSYGHLLGMLLVKSLDRSERILAAMKCRGFTGQFYLFEHFALKRRDVIFLSLSFVVILGLGWWGVIS